jgi:integrase/recombinase XerD
VNKTALSEGLQPNVNPVCIGAAQWSRDFDDYLSRVQGLAPRSRIKYCFFVDRFLAEFCGTAAPDWSSLRGEDLAAFVQREALRLKRNARATPGTAIRALLRYLTFVGAVRVGLEAAVPRMRRWKHAALPRYLSGTEIDRAVASVLDDTLQGRRNYAILLLLARTGLRAGEVIQLTLDDIDWGKGTLCIRSGKSRCERRLPLAQDVGAALCAYLEHGRPPSASRVVFLRVCAPFGALRNSAAVSKIARHALIRAGVVNTPAAAHIFRHSAAAGMLRGGASFKEIADVLGHASLETTAIYAKLDLAALSRVSLPWPGSAP